MNNLTKSSNLSLLLSSINLLLTSLRNSKASLVQCSIENRFFIWDCTRIALGLTFNQQQKLKNLQKIDEKILSKLATHIN
jgi:hypothetical protein